MSRAGGLFVFAALAAFLSTPTLQAEAVKVSSQIHLHMNPIRKVVLLLQSMEKKVRDELDEKQKLFDKFMCYCKASEASVTKSIEAAKDKIPNLESAIKEASAMKQQLSDELKQHKAERAEAQKALQTADALKEENMKSLTKDQAELKSNIMALGKAIISVQKGMESNFLQTDSARLLQKLSLSMDMAASDRDMLSAFLVGGDSAHMSDEDKESEDEEVHGGPQSGEILGILKQMHDSMNKDLKKIEDEIATIIGNNEALHAAKKREIKAASKAIEDKTAREGDLAVKVVTLKKEYEDTKESLEEDEKFLADLKNACKAKQNEWKEYEKDASAERVALSETIKLLNDDDALDLFKKTLPTPAESFEQVASADQDEASFLQVRSTRSRHGRRKVAATALSESSSDDPRMDLLELAVRGEKVGFDQIVKKIDDLRTLLRTEQKEDDKKKVYCETTIDKTEDELKQAKRSVSDMDAVIADAEDSLQEVNAQIEALTASISELDAQVKTATKRRKEEHTESVEALAQNGAAKSLLEVAKSKLRKFYGAKAKGGAAYLQEPTSRDKHVMALYEQQQASRDRWRQALERFGGSQEQQEVDAEDRGAGGAIAMIDNLREDLIKKMAELNTEEKNAQAEYERYIQDSSEKRAIDSKTLAEKEGVKAELEAGIHENKQTLGGLKDEVIMTNKELHGLHADCDWLLQKYDLRREARSDELDALAKARAVLSGADY